MYVVLGVQPLLFYRRVNARVLLESTNLVIASANNGAKLKCLIFPLSPFLKKGISTKMCKSISTKKKEETVPDFYTVLSLT